MLDLIKLGIAILLIAVFNYASHSIERPGLVVCFLIQLITRRSLRSIKSLLEEQDHPILPTLTHSTFFQPFHKLRSSVYLSRFILSCNSQTLQYSSSALTHSTTHFSMQPSHTWHCTLLAIRHSALHLSSPQTVYTTSFQPHKLCTTFLQPSDTLQYFFLAFTQPSSSSLQTLYSTSLQLSQTLHYILPALRHSTLHSSSHCTLDTTSLQP